MNFTKPLFGLFPGQGSQTVGMGMDFCESFSVAKELFSRADKALGFSLSDLCFSGPEEKLKQTAISQPAILTVSIAAYLAAKEKYGASLTLSAAAGHSLGEYSALVAAGSISFEDAVCLVHRRGSYMQEAVPEGKGAMLAVLGTEVAEIESIIASLSGLVEVANINAPGQTVLSGTVEGIAEYKSKAGGGKMIELPVSAPFHCSLMQPAADRLAVDLDATTFNDPSFPIYVNIDAKAVATASEVRDCLKRQVCGRVRWVESMQAAVADLAEFTAIEFGNGNVLTGLFKRINKDVERVNIANPQSLQ
jgi:[acyl-carrier-protein] S-malonyltransferase